MQKLISLLSGTLFGVGLTISGMVNPQKIIGFLDLGGIPGGTWDPTLALVMVGAIVVTAPAFLWAKRRKMSVLGAVMSVPKRRDIDRPLVIGALLFGVGWGLVGYCPGPALSGLAFGNWQTIIFVVAMLVGMGFFRRLNKG